MKKLLIWINSLLGAVVVIMLINNLASTGKKSVPAAVAVRKNAKRQDVQDKKYTPQPLPEINDAVEKIIGADVFSNVRSPLANVRSGRNEMTLVGIFKAGSVEGAIIKQTGGNRQFNPFIMQAMRMSGEMHCNRQFLL